MTLMICWRTCNDMKTSLFTPTPPRKLNAYAKYVRLQKRRRPPKLDLLSPLYPASVDHAAFFVPPAGLVVALC